MHTGSIVLAKQTRTNECTFRTLSGNIFSEKVPIMRAGQSQGAKIARHLTVPSSGMMPATATPDAHARAAGSLSPIPAPYI